MTKTYFTRSNAMRALRALDSPELWHVVPQGGAFAVELKDTLAGDPDWQVQEHNGKAVLVQDAPAVETTPDPVAVELEKMREELMRDPKVRIGAGVLRDRAVEKAAPKVAAPTPKVVAYGQVVLCFCEPLAMSTARMLAGQMAKKHKTPVQVRDAATFDVVELFEPPAKKARSSGTGAARTPREPGQLRDPATSPPAGKSGVIFKLATRKEGVTRAALNKLNGKDYVPWKSRLQQIAKPFGMIVVGDHTPDKQVIYRILSA